jgi:molecular chaperone HtpG
MVEKLEFQADISELMNLIIHAFYSNRDVFLREIISNASDALDKQRHHDLRSNKLDGKYGIRLSAKENTLLLEDTGVGMSREDLVENLSTIARSGTKQFIQSLQEKSDQIGQFGVGFYSVFLVADNVEVVTQKEGGPAYRWKSDAQQFYTLEEAPEESLEGGHGTRLLLTLKEDAKEYLEEKTLRRIVATHSSFITYPIELYTTKEIEVPVETSEEEEVEEEEVSTGKVEVEEVEVDEEASEKETEEKKPKTEKKTVQEWETINGDKPVWMMSPSDVKEEEYHGLYKAISKDSEPPLFYKHFQTEGTFEFRGVLFFPKRAPFDLLGERQREKRRIRLYVKKVLVLDELEKEMLPDWMNFVVGVIDSADLPLNVSREMLQQTKVLQALKTQLKKQVLDMLNTILDDEEKYISFYGSFQKNIKLGVHDGDSSLLKFVRVPCAEKDKKASDNIMSLSKYLENAVEGQKSIYYATGSEAEETAATRTYINRGYKVALFREPLDEFMLQKATRFEESDLINIGKEHPVPWSDGTEEKQEEFCKWLQEKITDKELDTVRLSTVLTAPEDTACCVVSTKFGWTGNMEKIMMAQPLSDTQTMSWMKGKKILELNWSHPLVQRYYGLFEDKSETDISKEVSLIYKSAVLSAGYPLENSTDFVRNVVECLHAQ